MKKLVLVLGLVMGSMLASDAFAAVSFSTVVKKEISKDKPKKEKKRKHKKCCSKTETTEAKGCAKKEAGCCKKKAAETPAPEPAK